MAGGADERVDQTDSSSLLDKIVDLPGYLRYGMPTSQKEALAVSGSLPGAPKDTSEGQEKANRYAAGYLFTRQHPKLAPHALAAANYLHGLFGDDPALQSFAQTGMNRALLEK